VTEPTPEARISAGLAASTQADERRAERRRLAAAEDENRETEDERLDRMIKRAEEDPAFDASLTSAQRIAMGYRRRNLLRAAALAGGDQR
jgi:hypothetical protein